MNITIDDSLFNPLTIPSEPLDVIGLNTLMEECIYMLPGCSDLMLRKELQRTFREFCRRTGTLFVHDTGIVTYRDPFLGLSRGDSEFFTLSGVYLNDSAVKADLVKDCGCVSIKFSLQEDENDTQGNPVEHVADAVYSCIPKVGTETAPTWFITKWADAIVAGTLFRLLAMPRKAWSDQDSAKLQGTEYQRLLNGAVIDRLTGGKNGDLNCRAPIPFL